MRSGLLEAVETGKIRPEVREALPVSENDRIAAAQVRIWAENGRLNETIGLEQDIGTLAPQEQALCREVQEAVESGRVTAELQEKLGLPGNERVAAGLLRTWAQDGTIARLIEDVQAGQVRGELERRGGRGINIYDKGDIIDSNNKHGTQKIKLEYKPSSGIILEANPKKATTILGVYAIDMNKIIKELGKAKSLDFGARSGEFNTLNIPDELYRTPDQFWEEYNRPWLDEVIERGDIIKMATDPTPDNLYRINLSTGVEELTGFGREITYLEQNGYIYDEILKEMRKEK